MKFLVSVEARYVVEAQSQDQAEALAIAAASCCGTRAPGIADSVDCRGTDLICCTREED
jgi:hypothetical protein